MGESVEPGTPPPDLSGQEISFVPGVLLDSPPPGRHFGDCLVEPPQDVFPGNTVSATFASGLFASNFVSTYPLGHLRNNLMLEETFLTVEKLENLEWKVVARDTDWETKLLWTRTNVVTGESTVEVIWDVPDNTPAGTYRLGHRGYHKTLLR